MPPWLGYDRLLNGAGVSLEGKVLVASPAGLGKAGRPGWPCERETSWQLLTLSMCLGPGAEPLPAPSDLTDPLVNKQREPGGP